MKKLFFIFLSLINLISCQAVSDIVALVTPCSEPTKNPSKTYDELMSNNIPIEYTFDGKTYLGGITGIVKQFHKEPSPSKSLTCNEFALILETKPTESTPVPETFTSLGDFKPQKIFIILDDKRIYEFDIEKYYLSFPSLDRKVIRFARGYKGNFTSILLLKDSKNRELLIKGIYDLS